jgi:hypothetical protein
VTANASGFLNACQGVAHYSAVFVDPARDDRYGPFSDIDVKSYSAVGWRVVPNDAGGRSGATAQKQTFDLVWARSQAAQRLENI